jgi:hypothetical protein
MTMGSQMASNVPAGPQDDEPVGPTGPRQLYAAFDSEPTRRVCEAVYFDAQLGRRILEVLLHRHHRAQPPDYELDTGAIVRHAWRARRWRLVRDTTLCAVLLAVCVGLGLQLPGRTSVVPAAAIVGLLVVADLVHRILRWRRVTTKIAARWLLRLLRHRPQRAAALLALLIALSIAFARNVVHLARLGAISVIGVGALVVLAIGLIDAALVSTWAKRCQRGSFLNGDPPLLRYQAPRLPSALEKRLGTIDHGPDPDQTESVAHGRVVVYDLSARRGKALINNAFVGSGESLGDFQINVDVSRGRTGADGVPLNPEKVSILDLHRTLERYIREQVEPGVWCGYRLYVDDTSLASGNDLLSDPYSGPPSVLPLAVHLGYLNEPTSSRRTYLCIQVPLAKWKGEIVVTLFVRGELTGDHLAVHNDVLILPDLKLANRAPKRYPPTDRWTWVTNVLRTGTTQAWRLLALSPYRRVRDSGFSVKRLVVRIRTRSWIKHKRSLQFGSIRSLREELARGSRVVHPNAIQDIRGTMAFLQHTLKSGLRRYLEDRNIDTSSLDEEMRNVINNQYNKIDQLNAKNVAFGEQSRAGDSTNGPDAPPADPQR